MEKNGELVFYYLRPIFSNYLENIDCDIEVGMNLRVGIFEKLFIMSFSIELLSQLLCDMRDWSNKQTNKQKNTR